MSLLEKLQQPTPSGISLIDKLRGLIPHQGQPIAQPGSQLENVLSSSRALGGQVKENIGQQLAELPEKPLLAVGNLTGVGYPTNYAKKLSTETTDEMFLTPKGKGIVGGMKFKEGGIDNKYALGQYAKRGGDVFNFAKKLGLSDKISERIANNFISQSIDRPSLKILKQTEENPKKIIAHEVMHNFFQIKDDLNPKFGENFWNTWENNIDDPVIQSINEDMKSRFYNFDNMSPEEIANERYAFLGQNVLNKGISSIPKQFREFYKDIVK